jgi:glycosyltransferase involved in cell wall biosynthesis
MLNNFYYQRGGSEQVLFEEKRILEENGHQVLAFSQAQPNNEHSEYANYFPPYTTNYENMPLLKRILSSINIVYSRKAGRAFLRFLEESQPDLVHAHNIYGGLTTSVLDAARKKGVPTVMTLHDYKLICPSYLMLNRGKICEDCRGGKFKYCLFNRCHKESFQASLVYCLESYFNKWLGKYDKIAYLICPSRFLFQKLCESGFDKNRLVYIPNYVDVRRFKPQFGRGAYLLYAGRLSREKGVLTLLKAVKRIRRL